MTRPRKIGMDYFPHDVDAVNDEKIEAMRALYGNDGYAFYFILLERIYRTETGELDLSNAAIRAALVKKIMVSDEKFDAMLQTAFEINLFDREAYEKRYVLTSRGIIERFNEINKLREKERNKKVFPRENSEETVGKTQGKFVENAGENSEETGESKVKKSKVKESKEKENISSSSSSISPPPSSYEAADDDADFKDIVNTFSSNIHPITPIEAEKLEHWLGDTEKDVVAAAIHEAVAHNARSMAYIETVLRTWQSNGIKTKAALEAYLRDRQDKLKSASPHKSKYSPYVDFEINARAAPDYTPEEIAKLVAGAGET